MSSIVEQVFSHAEKNADKIALTDGKKSLSYEELCRQVLNAQKVLKQNIVYGIIIIFIRKKKGNKNKWQR